MSQPARQLVQKLLNYCNILRNYGLSYGVARVERHLSVVEELAAVVSANVQRTTCLRQSILKTALNGELK
jgi:hypothetical protein